MHAPTGNTRAQNWLCGRRVHKPVLVYTEKCEPKFSILQALLKQGENLIMACGNKEIGHLTTSNHLKVFIKVNSLTKILKNNPVIPKITPLISKILNCSGKSLGHTENIKWGIDNEGVGLKQFISM